MRAKRNKGMALIVVLMVMLVLSILGVSFLSISTFQTNQAIREDKGLQAHYLARAGAEAALAAWQNAPSTAKPTGTFDPVYLSSSDAFVNTLPADLKGKFDVTITLNGTSNVIHATGTVGNVQKDVNVTINTISSVIPGPVPSYIDGSTTGFYDYTSRQINSGIFPPSSFSNRGTVKDEAKGGKGLKIPNKNRPSATQIFEKMLFTSAIQTIHNSIILKSNVIVFIEPVDFSLNTNSKGALILQVYGNLNGAVPILRSGVAWGVVIFSGVGYYYKDIVGGVVLRSASDIASNVSLGNLELITDQSILNGYLSGVVPTSLTVTSYSILWSK